MKAECESDHRHVGPWFRTKIMVGVHEEPRDITGNFQGISGRNRTKDQGAFHSLCGPIKFETRDWIKRSR